eukprot:gb/GEZN01005958.1/.p1 GENE.gb/GEZN01005958.1/~~gb/GEZN01005958.1/.p1  ORF type:complete len:529 (-),score=69.39 gb/GEZN01005958.1/:35-1621(-)
MPDHVEERFTLLGADGQDSVQVESISEISQEDSEPEKALDWRNRVWLRTIAAFWLLGLLNNASYVIMAAGAKHILDGGVAVIYMVDIFPGLCVKGSATFWFDRVSYGCRLSVASILMALSFLLVSNSRTTAFQLVGVACASLQSSLGEASILALSSRYPGAGPLTAWSSGTGFAGIFGYAWVVVLNIWWGLDFSLVLYIALCLPVLYYVVYLWMLPDLSDLPPAVPTADSFYQEFPPLFTEKEDEDRKEAVFQHLLLPREAFSGDSLPREAFDASRPRPISMETSDNTQDAYRLRQSSQSSQNRASEEQRNREREKMLYQQMQRERRASREMSNASTVVVDLNMWERLQFAGSLWRITGALFMVYWAEYAMQSGVFAAIGFPVGSEDARKKFYVYSNWSYQCGVFCSRSSGTLWSPSQCTMWKLSGLQAVILVIFFFDALHQWWYNEGLYAICFTVGLLGGSVYVHSFRLLSTYDHEVRELAMPIGAFACDCGILFGNLLGLLLQGCLYSASGISGSSFAVPGCANLR